MAARYDQCCHGEPGTVRAGDQVYILLPVRMHKLAPKYSEPMAVQKAIGNTIWLDKGQKLNLRQVLHHKSILRQPKPQDSPSSPPLPSSSLQTDDDDVALFPFPVAEPLSSHRDKAGHKPGSKPPPCRSQRRHHAKSFG